MEIDNRDKDKATFTSHDGLYRCLRLPSIHALCIHCLKVCRIALGLSTNCIRTTVDSQSLIATEEILLLRVLYPPIGSRNPSWQT